MSDLASKAFQPPPYRPDGGIEMQGLLLLRVGLAVVGAIVGVVANFVSQWIYLIHLVPDGDRGPARPDRKPAGPGRQDPTRADVQAFWKVCDGSRDFFAYLDAQAELGVSITRALSSDEGVSLGYTGTIVYWLLEVLVVALIVLGMVRQQAAMPFCTLCQAWKDGEPLGFLRGKKAEVRAAVESGALSDWIALSPTVE